MKKVGIGFLSVFILVPLAFSMAEVQKEKKVVDRRK